MVGIVGVRGRLRSPRDQRHPRPDLRRLRHRRRFHPTDPAGGVASPRVPVLRAAGHRERWRVEAVVRGRVEVAVGVGARPGTRRASGHARRDGTRDARARHRAGARAVARRRTRRARLGGRSHRYRHRVDPPRGPARHADGHDLPHARGVLPSVAARAEWSPALAATTRASPTRRSAPTTRWSTCAGCAGSRRRAPSGDAASMRSNPQRSSAHWSTCCESSRSTRTRRVASTTHSLTASGAWSRSTACGRGTTSVATSCSPARTSSRERCSTSPCSRRTSRLSTTSTSMRSSRCRASASW